MPCVCDHAKERNLDKRSPIGHDCDATYCSIYVCVVIKADKSIMMMCRHNAPIVTSC